MTVFSSVRLFAACLCALLLSSCVAQNSGPISVSYGGTPVLVDGLRLPAKVEGPALSLGFGEGFEPRFWPGVNLGSSIPGTAPGEVAPSKSDYQRWLEGMAELGTRVVRVYTILRPAFYDALSEHNARHAQDPLYVIQGVWIPEEQFYATRDVYSPQVEAGFDSELRDAVDVVHGEADLPMRPGHAGGIYRHSVARWLLAWSIGIEWDPTTVAASDAKNSSRPAYSGRFFSSKIGSTPMESWIASKLNYVAQLEADRGWSRPLTFTNWLTTDPLHHRYEPHPDEDRISVDAMHIQANASWPGGFFASYHVYPYYPDFLGLDPTYASYRTSDGGVDPYAGYLNDLKKHHQGQAVMITEFGLPSSLGTAHLGPLGRNQGGLSERNATTKNVEMLRDILNEGFAGAIVFEWVDEWFKLSWNTMDFEIPSERRPYWHNALTNEQHFGIIAAEPGADSAVLVDGHGSEWRHNGNTHLASSKGQLRELRAVYDEGYLYLLAVVDGSRRWEGLTFAFDPRPGGNGGLEGRPGVEPEADVQLTFSPGNLAVLKQAAWTDPFSRQYGLVRKYAPVDPADLRMRSGKWVLPRLLLSAPIDVPETGIRRTAQIQTFDKLPWGNTNPRHPDFDNRALVAGSGNVLEVRVPWAFLTYSDPSSVRVYVPGNDGTVASEVVGKLGLSVVTADGSIVRTQGVEMKGWDRVQWHERKKAGWATLKSAFHQVAQEPVVSTDVTAR